MDSLKSGLKGAMSEGFTVQAAGVGGVTVSAGSARDGTPVSVRELISGRMKVKCPPLKCLKLNARS
jgi:hypothetical protein